MDIALVLFIFLLGLICGSFFNVVGLRVPKGIPFSTDRSYCPSCNKQLVWYELIPVVSFIIQQRKCRKCGQTISLMYPIVELVTGILFVFSYYKVGLHIEWMTVLLFISMLMIVFVSDVSYMIIPNKVLLFFFPLFIGMRMIQPLDPWWSAFVGGLGAFLLIAAIILVSRGGMGAGDMKLFGVLGLVLGIKKVLLTFFLASLLGAVVGIGLLSLKVIKRKQPIPFGPYIMIAAFISYFYGDVFMMWYMDLLH